MKWKTFEHTLMLVLTIILTYMWLRIPMLSRYSLQAFSISILAFFIIKRTKNAKLWHIMPNPLSAESIAITFAFLLLIGETGNLHSQFFALGYIHLFFLTLVTSSSTLIITTLAVMMFHYLLSPPLGTIEISNLISLPLMALFFLFAKKQYDELQLEQAIIREEADKIEKVEKTEQSLEDLVFGSVKPQLETLWQGLEKNELPMADVQLKLLSVINEIEKKSVKKELPADQHA